MVGCEEVVGCGAAANGRLVQSEKALAISRSCTNATAVSIDRRRPSAPTGTAAGSRTQRGFRGDFVPRDPWLPENHRRWIRVRTHLKQAASRRACGRVPSGGRLPGARIGGERATPLSRRSSGEASRYDGPAILNSEFSISFDGLPSQRRNRKTIAPVRGRRSAISAQ